MAAKNENYSFLQSWSDIFVDEYERTSSVMSDYHFHDYYEISLIMSGEVRAFTPGITSDSCNPCVVICAPGVHHYVTCTEGTLYRRINVIFSEEFIAASGDFEKVKRIFKRDGNIIHINEGDVENLADVLKMIKKEDDRFRCRLLLLYYLSLLADMDGEAHLSEIPEYISSTLTIIKERCAEKLVASEIAQELNVGRTTLMTNFKKYTDMTIGEYILRCRLILAIELLHSGTSEKEVAGKCGFGETSNLTRCFKRRFGIPPKKYINSINKHSKTNHLYLH